jgi:hypothetical protein
MILQIEGHSTSSGDKTKNLGLFQLHVERRRMEKLVVRMKFFRMKLLLKLSISGEETA